jgi:hypothetical protein
MKIIIEVGDDSDCPMTLDRRGDEIFFTAMDNGDEFAITLAEADDFIQALQILLGR